MSVCKRPTCNRKANPRRNTGLCHQHYLVAPVRGYVDSTPAREHIALLRARGMTLRMLTEHGVSRFGVRLIQNNPRIRAATENKVLAIPVPAKQIRSGAPVDSTGTRRRIKALVAMGWPQAMIAAELNTKQTAVSALTRGTYCTSETAIAVKALFDRWGMTVGPSALSRQRARKAGWLPPLSWDDIDNPDEQPAPTVEASVSWADRYTELKDIGVPESRIPERMGMKPKSFERQLMRLGITKGAA